MQAATQDEAQKGEGMEAEEADAAGGLDEGPLPEVTLLASLQFPWQVLRESLGQSEQPHGCEMAQVMDAPATPPQAQSSRFGPSQSGRQAEGRAAAEQGGDQPPTAQHKALQQSNPYRSLGVCFSGTLRTCRSSGLQCGLDAVFA
jgi:hypothetical protein